MSTFWHTVAGIVVGGIISAVISYIFAQQASKELREEADGLRRETEDVRHYINALITYLEAAGMIQVRRDENGRPIETRIIRLSAAMSGVSGVSATPTVQERPAQRPWWRRVFGG
jgi:gas vesicle protein